MAHKCLITFLSLAPDGFMALNFGSSDSSVHHYTDSRHTTNNSLTMQNHETLFAFAATNQGSSSRPMLLNTITNADIRPQVGSIRYGMETMRSFSQNPEALRSRKRRTQEAIDSKSTRPTALTPQQRPRLSTDFVITEDDFVEQLLPVEVFQAHQSIPIDLRPIGPEYLIPTSFCGLLNVKCTFCNALHFTEEQPRDGLFQNCCNKGKVKLILPSTDFPSMLKD